MVADIPAALADIRINGQAHTVKNGDRLTYETLVEMAGLPPAPDYSVTYRGAAQRTREGTLGPGKAATVQPGTVFGVIRTGVA